MAEKELYSKLSATATSYIFSCLPKTPGSNDPAPRAILTNLAPTLRLRWGHTFFVATKPHLQGEKTGDGFISHLLLMAKALETWSIDITNICVDVDTRSVVVRGDYHMVPRNGEEVLNDIVFWMFMDESGERMVKCIEFVDPVASTELARRMNAGAGER